MAILARATVLSAVTVVASGIAASPANAESWTCTYPGFIHNRPAVTVRFSIENGKLVDNTLGGATKYEVVENNEYSVIAVDHYSKFDGLKGAVRIFSATVIIEKRLGQFIYMIGEIGEEPGYHKGSCGKG